MTPQPLSDGYHFERLFGIVLLIQMRELKPTAHISDPIMIPTTCSHPGSIKTQLTGVIWNIIRPCYCPNPIGIISNHLTELEAKLHPYIYRHSNISPRVYPAGSNQSQQPSSVQQANMHINQSTPLRSNCLILLFVKSPGTRLETHLR